MRWTVVAMAVLMAGCAAKGERSFDAVLKGDLQAGTLTLTCRDSSTGACHLLVQTGDKVDRIEAAKGTTAAATGLDDRSRYCLDAEAPGDGCRLMPVIEGEQIIRNRKTGS